MVEEVTTTLVSKPELPSVPAFPRACAGITVVIPPLPKFRNNRDPRVQQAQLRPPTPLFPPPASLPPQHISPDSCFPAPPQTMADMPSNPRPPSRPSPPVHDRRRSGRGIPTPRTPTSPTAQRGSPTTGTPNGNGGLRPPFSPQRHPQRQHRPGHRSSASRHGNFATGREEFNFTDSELSDDDEDSEENGHARRSRRDDEEVWIDPGDDDEDVDYYGILNVSRNVREPSCSFASGIGRVKRERERERRQEQRADCPTLYGHWLTSFFHTGHD